MGWIRTFSVIIMLFYSGQSIFGATTNIHLFYGEGCSHCVAAKKALNELQQDYPDVKLYTYEVWHDTANASKLKQLAKSYGREPQVVPIIFIGDELFVGYTQSSRSWIEDKIVYCLEYGCEDPMDRLAVTEVDTSPGSVSQAEVDKVLQEAQEPENARINVPIIGEVDAVKTSLPLITIAIGFLDGFNPCAFFVLLFLLSMLICAKSKKRMLLIGGTFVFISGFIYFLFMAAWLNLFLVMGKVELITSVAGSIGMLIGAINIKDFFWFKKGVSLTISDENKPKLFQRMRGLIKAESLVTMMIGTVALAVAANTYELLCTAGFPMVYTRILTLNELSPSIYYSYLGLYCLVYVIPLATIVLIATLALRVSKLTESQGESLKLLSGTMMFTLGLVLLINPEVLSHISTSISIIALALGITFTIIGIRYALSRHS